MVREGIMGAAALPTPNYFFEASSALAGQPVKTQNAMARLLHHDAPVVKGKAQGLVPILGVPKVSPNWQRAFKKPGCRSQCLPHTACSGFTPATAFKESLRARSVSNTISRGDAPAR